MLKRNIKIYIYTHESISSTYNMLPGAVDLQGPPPMSRLPIILNNDYQESNIRKKTSQLTQFPSLYLSTLFCEWFPGLILYTIFASL